MCVSASPSIKLAALPTVIPVGSTAAGSVVASSASLLATHVLVDAGQLCAQPDERQLPLVDELAAAPTPIPARIQFLLH